MTWSKRYPWIAESTLNNRYKQFVIDGEAVMLDVDGISDFNALHSGKHNDEVQLYAFDILALDGDDLRSLPLSMRKAHLERLLARRPDGIFISPFEQGEIGPDLFRAACNMGLDGLVSKRLDRPYRGGRSKDWIKVKNRTSQECSGCGATVAKDLRVRIHRCMQCDLEVHRDINAAKNVLRRAVAGPWPAQRTVLRLRLPSGPASLLFFITTYC